MFDRPRLRVSGMARMGLITTSLVGTLVFGGGTFTAVAQDATPGASPAGDCMPGQMDMGMATPTDMATPAAAEAPVGTPADDAAVQAATDFVNNAKACISDAASLATLVTVNLVSSYGGYDSIQAAIDDGFFEDATFGDAEIGDVMTYDDGSVSVDVNNQHPTEYQVASERWWLVDVDGAWKLNAIQGGLPVEVDGDSAAVGINLKETGDGQYTIEANSSSVVATDVLILQGISAATNKEPHMLVVLQVPEGMAAADVAAGKVAEEDTVGIGFIDGIMPGTSQDMYLVGLPAGKYVLACFVGGPDGTPHAFNGMVADFEVTAPEPVASPSS